MRVQLRYTELPPKLRKIEKLAKDILEDNELLDFIAENTLDYRDFEIFHHALCNLALLHLNLFKEVRGDE